MSFLAAAAGVAAGAQVIKGLNGIFQSKKGKKMAKANKRPTYEIPGEFQKNVAESEMMARTGTPQEQYNNQMNNIQRTQAGALRVFGRNGGNTGSLASIIRAGNDATGDLVAKDSFDRQQNRRFMFGQRGLYAQQKLAKQQWDKFDKYNENAMAAAAMQGAGRQNAMGALDGLSQIGTSFLGAKKG